LLREPLDDLVDEIKRCFAYVMQNFPELAASRLLLAGGGAKLPGLPAYLEADLGLSVAPLSNVPATQPCQTEPPRWERPLPSTVVQPEAAAALGAAILDVESL
jgi:Tfp pilus assembly PilM family ATPase